MPVKFNIEDDKPQVEEQEYRALQNENILPSQVAFQLKRYDDIIKFVQTPKFKPELCGVVEQDLVLTGLKSAMQSRLNSYMTICDAGNELQKNPKDEKNNYILCYIEPYKERIRNEAIELYSIIKDTCEMFLNIENSIPECETNNWKVRADCERYCNMIHEGELKEGFLNLSEESYTYAVAAADKGGLAASNYWRLAAMLNFTIFKKDLKKDTASAISMASEVFHAAISEMYKIEDDDKQYQKTVEVVTALQRNVRSWAKEQGYSKSELNDLFKLAGSADEELPDLDF